MHDIIVFVRSFGDEGGAVVGKYWPGRRKIPTPSQDSAVAKGYLSQILSRAEILRGAARLLSLGNFLLKRPKKIKPKTKNPKETKLRKASRRKINEDFPRDP